MLITHIRQNFAAAFFPRLSEWSCASCLLALGFMLSKNPDLMSTSKTQAYQLMQLIATQATWAAVMKVFALIRLTILVVNGAWRRSPHLRSVSAFLTCFFWTQITLSFLPTFGFAFIFALWILLQDFANSVRAARDARIVDHAYAKGGTAGGQD